MAIQDRYALTVDQTADGANNNTSGLKTVTRNPIIGSDGYFDFENETPERFDVIVKGTSSPNFTVQLYGLDIDGDDIPLGDPISTWTTPNQVIFQDGPRCTWRKLKLVVSSYVAGTLNASIQYA